MWQCFHSYAWQVARSDRQAVDYSSVKHKQPHTASITLCSLFDFVELELVCVFAIMLLKLIPTTIHCHYVSQSHAVCPVEQDALW